MGKILKFLAVVLIVFLYFAISAKEVSAAALTSLSDTISTSRPSPSSPLSANATSGTTQFSIANNGSRYFYADSAKLFRAGALIGSVELVATQSSALTTVYLQGTTDAAGQAGTDVLITPITAMHTIQFTVPSSVPVSGDILITFPSMTSGDANNEASPSATTFQGNNMDADDTTLIQTFDDAGDISGNITETWTDSTGANSPTLLLALDASTSIAGGSVVKIYIGCTTATSTSCSAQSPRVINPTKTAAAGTADTWTVNVQTRDASDNVLDNGKTRIATIETVQVVANVDPTLSFSIAGVAGSQTIVANNSACTGNTDAIDAASLPTLVDLGTLSSASLRIAAQDMTVSTNADAGYVLTATSSGQLRIAGTSTVIDSAVAESVIAAGTEEFGIHPCGADANATEYVADGLETGSSTGEVAWPTATGGIDNLASNAGPVASVRTTIEYAGTVSGTTEAGLYQTEVTYIVTATF